MTRRWGDDNEERSAVAKKAQDAYARAAQVQELVNAVDARQDTQEMELAELRAMCQGLARRVRELERERAGA
jgi:hypothetical protein